jgi:putative ABC transport system permease protein
MGAGLFQIINLQLREFVFLVLIANAIVWPFAWWWASTWLTEFAYHIKVDPMIFIATLAGALLLVISTLLYHSIKMAKTDPVTSLRYE